MCNLINPLPDEEFVGWKIVVKREDGYYSAAMGFKYEEGAVPVIRTQKRLCGFFVDDILQSVDAPAMHGRTAVFVDSRDANKLVNEIRKYQEGYHMEEIEVVQAKIKKDLIGGYYDLAPVVAGKEIYFKDIKLIKKNGQSI